MKTDDWKENGFCKNCKKEVIFDCIHTYIEIDRLGTIDSLSAYKKCNDCQIVIEEFKKEKDNAVFADKD